MCKVFNDYFCSVFTREDMSSIPQCQDASIGGIIQFSSITPNRVSKCIKSIKPTTSRGPSGYTNKFLKDFSGALCLPLSIIFNISLSHNIVPSVWKVTNVVPILKKGSKGEASNYWPVSLTCVIGKLLERILKKDIVEHLTLNNIISDTQHGFMASRSCVTNLLTFLETVTSTVDGGNAFDIIYYDFSKAFDKVPRARLIEKLKSVGIFGQVLDWITNWLTGRKQRTTLNGKNSEWSDVLSGVPQGSVLGPLLFIIFINDIDYCATLITLLLKFADNTKFGNIIRKVSDNYELQECVNKLSAWAKEWGMCFNAKKCKVLHVGRSNPGHTYTMDGVNLLNVNSEKDIGVTVTDTLKPSDHCKNSAQTARAVLNQLLRSFLYRDKFIF